MCDPMTGPAGMSGGAWLFPGLSLAVLLAAALAGFAVLTWLMLRRPAAVESGQPQALAAAKERYARGEIGHAELNRILDTLLQAESRNDGDAGPKRR